MKLKLIWNSGSGVLHSRFSMDPLLLRFLSIWKIPRPHSTPVSSSRSLFFLNLSPPVQLCGSSLAVVNPDSSVWMWWPWSLRIGRSAGWTYTLLLLMLVCVGNEISLLAFFIRFLYYQNLFHCLKKRAKDDLGSTIQINLGKFAHDLGFYNS